EVVADCSAGSSNHVVAAVAAARPAFGSWALSPIMPRHDILKRAADELRNRSEELGRLLSREQGKTLAEGKGEVVRSAQIIDFFAGECLRQQGEKLASTRPGVEVEVMREPLGVIGIITPWNIPMGIP